MGFTQQPKPIDLIEKNFLNPPQSAKPWVFWYWLHGAVSKEGITADLEAMKEVGIGGAYLMPIKDTSSSIPFQPQVKQLTPEWWSMVKFAMQEAKRLKLQLGIHVSDGFALAGGPWITPELSMQKLVWTKTYIKNGDTEKINLDQPESYNGFYKDVAVFAYPANSSYAFNDLVLVPTVTASDGTKPQFLSFYDDDNKEIFRSDTTCWIQYRYPEPFTCRSIRIHEGTNNYQAQRLIIQKCDDGVNFISVDTLQPPRHGWQDWNQPYTHAIKTFTAKYIRFVWKKEGTEPGSEDLDAAKWRPVLRVRGIYISDEPVINNYEAKNGSVWRIAENTTTNEVSKTNAVPINKILNLTDKLSADGSLMWNPPAGNWIIVRIGHTSTGAVNSTAGGGKGLECDKFSSAATTLQFNNWFGKFYTETDAALAKQVIKVFHVDSWECGSQNWSKNFAAEFKKRRGYDLLPYLLVMTGTPVNDATTSEKVLHDVRLTIAELVNDKFYLTLKNLAHAKGCLFSAESIAPIFVSDGLMHYKHVDIPMGEFWLNSPTHDKPNDLLDAISGAHIYGKNIVQAEAFTTLRSDWGEHPGNLKAVGDRAFASGINKFSLHVFMHNPWMDKKPGMTLDGIGLFYQRDQTWFKQSKAWIDYLTRCQALLQLGKPVIDIGVFTGEEIPRRSILPDRLVNTLPGIFGKEKVEAEIRRLQNEGQPMRTIPDGVTHSANMADPENYIDALKGYSYDCFNPDVLMQMKVVNGKVVTSGGASYAVLVIPGKHPMNPNEVMSDAVRSKLKQLAGAGARIIADTAYWKIAAGNKNFINAPFNKNSFEQLGIKKDLLYDTLRRGTSEWNEKGWPPNLGVCRRDIGDRMIYFISNQNDHLQWYDFSFRYKGLKPEIYDPVTGKIDKPFSADTIGGFVNFFESFEPYESKFIIFSKQGLPEPFDDTKWPRIFSSIETLYSDWEITFKNKEGEQIRRLVFDTARLAKGFVKEVFDNIMLKNWTDDSSLFIKYFSGTAIYHTTYNFDKNPDTVNVVELRLNELYNLASVKVNSIDCGTVWTKPYSVDIKKAIKQGKNTIEIEVTNTWRNHLIGDELRQGERTTWLNSPYKMTGKPLLPAGIIGYVEIFTKWGE
jgi:(4-O-methyl)-D-glucuronate---lignin esterase